MELPGTEIPALREKEAPPPLAVPAGERASVLVVDDNPVKRTQVTSILDDLGLEVVTAASGREALRHLLARDFALILLDVYMPTMDGYETAELIHGRPRSAHTPIIFVTAEASSEAERSRGYASGGVDWVFTPIAPEVLRAKVKVFIDLFYLTRVARRQAEELQARTAEVQLKNLQLETASRMKSEFLATMSHELRTPLNVIIGFSEVLRDGLMGELTAEQKTCVEDIFASGWHLLSLINDILDLSKVEAGRMTLDLEPFPVGETLDACLSLLKEKALNHRVTLDLELAADLGHICADQRKFKQIVFNLLSNAVKFSPEQSAVRVAARRVGRQEVRVDGEEGSAGRLVPLPVGEFTEFLEIVVADSGIGIAEADLGRLFQPFMQLDASLERHYEGTGLGLALVRRLAALHGGTVGVVSGLGRGSQFYAWLPWRSADTTRTPAPAVEEPPQPAAPAARLLALVIEDDPVAARLLTVQLENAGFRVAAATTGEEGLTLAQSEIPALITLDVLLPDMGGWEVLERLKADHRLATIPVVIASIVADEARGFALGAAQVLAKPVTRESLLGALTRLPLGRRAGRRRFTVLVVDDDPHAVDLVAAQLKGTAYRVVPAYGGDEAITVARQVVPDLVILDLMMPETNGFDVVEALKDDPQLAAVPIIILTGKLVTARDRRRLNGYVEKIIQKSSFDVGQFTAEVQRALVADSIPRR